MARGRNKARPNPDGEVAISDYRHAGVSRKNNPPASIAAEGWTPYIPQVRYSYSPRLPPELRFDETGAADQLPELLARARQGPLTDEEIRVLAEALRMHEPWLEWAGKREARGLALDPVALHIHERVSTQALLKVATRQDVTRDLFADPEQEYHEAVQFCEDDEINIDRTGCAFYTAGPNLLLKERNPCSDRVSMSQTPRKVSRDKNVTQSQTVAYSRNEPQTPAHDVAIWPIATNKGSAPYTTWAICTLDIRLIFW